ncbi:uncharacterized protein [Phyllobates terribilis]|uniref:uncharacterized protein n=1 Tax=Phyllobates terribilis TaxID=111132 RepID=UPI003CCB6EA5
MRKVNTERKTFVVTPLTYHTHCTRAHNVVTRWIIQMDLIKLLCGLVTSYLYLGAVSAQVSVNGSLGGSVDFILHITLPANRAITWRTGEGSIYIARILNNDPPTYNTSYTSRTLLFPNGTLRLDKLTDADKRIYGVTVENQADFTNQVVDYQLGVFPPLSAPVLRSSVTTNNPFVNGANMSLQCDTGNQTVTTYTFYRDSQKIICSERLICSGSFLNFTPVAEIDSGSYTCTIQNPVSSNTSNSLSLSVYFPVSNVTVTSNVSGLVWPGLDSVSLRCSAYGTNVSYSWSLKGASTSGGGRYILTDNSKALVISPVSTDDNGPFICTAKNLVNSLNSSDVKFNLASPVSAVTLTSNTSAVLWAGEDSASLHCSAQGSAITFSWSLNGNQVSSKPPYSIIQSDSPPNSNLTISPVSKIDIGPFTCMASNRANSMTSRAANLSVNWSPDGNIVCTAQPIGQIVQLGCSWPGGKPAANVTMIFGNVQNASINQVFRNVSSSSNIQGSSLTCNGYQRRNSSCLVPFETPTSPIHKNDTVTPGIVGGEVNLTVDLQAGAQSRATDSSAQVLPATFAWFWGNNSTAIQTGGKFRVDSTPYTSTLNIDKLTDAESGDYKCLAENFIGSTTFLFNVKVSQTGGGSSSGLDGGAIAGIVIGVLAGVALIGVIAFFILKKHKCKAPEAAYKDPDSTPHVYETQLPGIAMNSTPTRKEESNYQELTHGNKSIYHTYGNKNFFLLRPLTYHTHCTRAHNVVTCWIIQMDLIKPLCGLVMSYLYLGAVSAQVSVNGSLGGSVDFILYITIPDNRAITWRTEGGAIYIVRILNNDPPIYSTSYASRTQLFPNGTLRLEKLTDADKRIYNVIVENQVDFTSQMVDYQLGVFPPLNTPVLLSNVAINKPFVNGTNMTLQCDAGIQTVTTYTFHRDGQKIICSEHLICRGSFLDFTPVAEIDSGSYTCTIQNPVSSNTSGSLSLTVYFPVSNVAVTSNVSGLVWPGLDSASLRCLAHGTNVSYLWSLQGAPISGGGRYTLTDNNSTLIISPVSTNDNGSFVCTAKNLANSQKSSDLKFILASPVSAVTLYSLKSSGIWAGEDFAHFYCSAQGSNITFSWSLNGSQISAEPPYHINQGDSPPNSNIFIIPVSKTDNGLITCEATNRANNITSSAANLNVNWSPKGKIGCTVQPTNQIVNFGCSWPGGKPAGNVTMIFGDVQNTSINEVYRNVSSSSDIHGSSLTCNGNQLGRTSNCVVKLERPNSPDHKNDTITPALVGGAVNLTVDLQAGAQSRATASSAQVFPATFFWFQGNSSTPIQTGGKFNVDSTPYASTLNIDKLTKAEFGEYKCAAENLIGSTTFLFNVKVSQTGGGSSSGLNGDAIAGIVIGVLAGVALIGVIAFFILKKRNTPKATYKDSGSAPVHLYETQLPGAVINTAPPKMEEENYQQLTHGNKLVYHTVMPGSGR